MGFLKEPGSRSGFIGKMYGIRTYVYARILMQPYDRVSKLHLGRLRYGCTLSLHVLTLLEAIGHHTLAEVENLTHLISEAVVVL